MSEIEQRWITVDGFPASVFGHPDDLYFYSVCTVPNYDHHLTQIAGACISDGAVALDVGANIGYFALSLAANARRAGIDGLSIYSFEPAEINWKPFERMVEANRPLSTPINLRRFGLSSENRSASHSYSPANTAGAHISAGLGGPYTESETIELRTLDSFLEAEQIDRVDFIKIDIEGHEQVLLSSIEDLIETHRPAILIEVNGWVVDVVARTATSVFVDYLCSLAPHVYGVHSDGTHIDVVADRTEYLRANLLAKTHQDVYLDFDPARVERVLASMHEAPAPPA